MLDLLNKTETENRLDTAAKRSLIEAELRKDAGRSDRAIADALNNGDKNGICHKTVAAHRKRLGIASPMGNSAVPSVLPGVGDVVASSTARVADVIAEVDNATGGDPDGYTFWPIPRQATIECREQPDGGVEIWQEGQHGGADDTIIHVAAGNSVMLARHILYAAGFRTVGIYTHEKGEGNIDLENGDLASNFYDEKPGYGPVR
jgi:hypothetical protein